MTLRLLSYNIKFGGAGREEALAAVIRAARSDVVVLQEATKPDVIAQLARDTGFEHWGARRGESLGFLSRQPLEHVEWRKPRVSRHAFIEIVPAGLPWTIVGVHLSAVHAAWTEQRRRYELRALLLAIQQHQPPLVRGRRIKLRYAHQGGRNPPIIVVHGNQVQHVPDAYRRYLANLFRKHFRLEGAPVRVEFRADENPFKGRRNPLTPRQVRSRKRLMKRAKR